MSDVGRYSEVSGASRDKIPRIQCLPSSSASENNACHTKDVSLLSDSISGGTESATVESEEKTMSCHLQRDLHLLLKPELAQLCETLHLSVPIFLFVDGSLFSSVFK